MASLGCGDRGRVVVLVPRMSEVFTSLLSSDVWVLAIRFNNSLKICEIKRDRVRFVVLFVPSESFHGPERRGKVCGRRNQHELFELLHQHGKTVPTAILPRTSQHDAAKHPLRFTLEILCLLGTKFDISTLTEKLCSSWILSLEFVLPCLCMKYTWHYRSLYLSCIHQTTSFGF